MIRAEADQIQVSKSRGVQIQWKDGHRSEYGLKYLRERCPCASCTGAHGHAPEAPAAENSPFPMFKPALKLDGVEPVGRYGLQFEWNDGHSTGIYSFDYLRQICTCADCAAGSQES